MDLLDLVQNVRALLFQKRPVAFAFLDRHRQIDLARNVGQITTGAQRRSNFAPRLEIETKRFGQLQYRDTVIVLRGNQLWDLVIELDLRLENIEPRNGAGFKTVLLIFQLAVQQVNRLLLHHD